MVDYVIELNPARKLDKNNLAKLKHPLQAMMRRGRRFGLPEVKFDHVRQSLMVINFTGDYRDLAQYIYKLADNSKLHDPVVALAPTIREANIEERNQYLLHRQEELEGFAEQKPEYDKRLELFNALQADKIEAERQLYDAQKENRGLKENYARKSLQNKRLQNRIGELESLEDRIDELLVQGSDATKIRIGEVAKSTNKLREYERKLKEMKITNPEEALRISSMSLAQYASEMLGNEFESDEDVIRASEVTKFEDTVEYSKLIRKYDEAKKAMHFVSTVDVKDLPELVRSVYEQVISNKRDYENTIGEFDKAKKNI